MSPYLSFEFLPLFLSEANFKNKFKKHHFISTRREVRTCLLENNFLIVIFYRITKLTEEQNLGAKCRTT